MNTLCWVTSLLFIVIVLSVVFQDYAQKKKEEFMGQDIDSLGGLLIFLGIMVAILVGLAFVLKKFGNNSIITLVQ